MSTLFDLRSGLRTLLNDNAAEGYVWPDAALDLHINSALRSYGRFFPREMETTITTVEEEVEYTLPADCLAVVRVEVVGATGRSLLQEGGDDTGAGYDVFGGKLILGLAPTTGDQIATVRYLASHVRLLSDADVSTVPAADEDLVLAFAAAQAIHSLEAEEARRQRFEQRAGRPAASVAALYYEQYEKGIRNRDPGIRVGRLVAT